MAKLFINSPQALELFVYIATTWSKKPNKLNKEPLLLSSLSSSEAVDELKKKKYGNRQMCEALAADVFDTVDDENGKPITENRTWFFFFFLKLKQGEPIIVENEILNSIERWIKEENPGTDYKLYYPEKIKDLDIPIKQDKFDDTFWSMWTYEYWNKSDENENLQRQHVIVHQVLHFRKFGRVHMYARHIQKGWDQDYVGTYSIGGADDNFLNIQMKLESTGKKNLDMVFYVGRHDLTMALGEYRNLGVAMYCGPLLIEPMNVKNIDRSLHLKYYTVNDEAVPAHVKSLYKYPWECMTEMPGIVTDIYTLDQFFLERDKIRKNSI